MGRHTPDYTRIHWSTVEYTRVHRNTLEYTGVHWIKGKITAATSKVKGRSKVEFNANVLQYQMKNDPTAR